MWTSIKNLTGFFKVEHPQSRGVYAVTTGTLRGEMLVLVREEIVNYCFFSLTTQTNKRIPKEKFHFGLENLIVEYVKRIPHKIHNLIISQYDKNESDNRCE